MSDKPISIDWSFVIGKEIIQIAVGKYDVNIYFSEDICFSASGPLSFEGVTADSEMGELFINLASRLISLLGAVVTKVAVEDKEAALRLDF